MRKIYILGDKQENFPTLNNAGHINDHQDEETFNRILQAVLELGHDCEFFGGVPELITAYENAYSYPDSLFLNFSDGMTQRYSRTQIPVLCDLLGINYCGSGTFETSLATNKYYSKIAVQKLGITCPNGVLISPATVWNENMFNDLEFPVFIKPNLEGSSAGISKNGICISYNEVYEKTQIMLQSFEEVLVEEFIQGYDITNFIIGNGVDIQLNEPLIAYHNKELVFGDSVMTMDDYLVRSNTYESVAAVINSDLAEKIKQISLEIVLHFNLHDYSRLDFRVTQNNKIFFLEANTCPAVHEKSQAGAICKLKNISFSEFISYFIDSATSRLGI